MLEEGRKDYVVGVYEGHFPGLAKRPTITIFLGHGGTFNLISIEFSNCS